MKFISEKQDLVADFLGKNQGVLTTDELKILLRPKNNLQFYREIRVLESNSIIFPFSRGVYISQKPNLEIVSQRMQPKSYVSFGCALSKSLVVGSVPSKTVYAIKLGKSRTYKSIFGEIVHLGISPDLFFGFETQNGINIANKEKAFLDTLYYYLKGQKFSFDIFSDINVQMLDRHVVEKYLKKYKNSKFVSFVKGFFV